LFLSKIGDYFTSLTTDKRFILLEDGSWDLRNRHTSDKLIKTVEEDDDEEIEEVQEEEEDDENNYDSIDNDEDIDDTNEDLKDLVVLDEDELELEQ